ncbi:MULTISPECIES: Cof-type HAD-IIB family hydrolase [Bacillus]|uniref:Cof-type HAD-IIB family hydrolase n=1 Tax=Bacillus TaxID=1386 RepID=UPI00042A2548|nr:MULTISPECIES: Cof-type HAD-IIB family hydrolase [Bacillus]QHZ46643.1 Cof-type HAD-IIB family hydrolase [Bacillus sp. NSP9.1]WFA06776.1 Cof-type HAD-IIB family hydrolase [Bacillus sp. HSf4]
MDKKLIFFDIDGTIYDHDKKIPASTKRAISDLKAHGHHVFIATGRAPFMVGEVLEELDIHSFVSYNGQYVVFEGEVIYKNPLSAASLESLLEHSDQCGHPIVFMGEEGMRASIGDHPSILEGIGSLKVAPPQPDRSYYQGRDIFQVLLFCDEKDEEQYRRFREFNFIRWHERSTDVLPAGGSKAEGIKKVIEKLPFARKDTYAFGDGLNDLKMIEFAGTGVAMGNAVEELKKIADFVTKPVDEDGIAYAVEALGLLK